jgi:hypothetical protein
MTLKRIPPFVLVLALAGCSHDAADPPDLALRDAFIPDLAGPPDQSTGADLAQPFEWVREFPPMSGELESVSGSGPSDVYVCCTADAQVLHSTGNGVWTAQPTGAAAPLHSVFALSPSEVYVVGAGGTILRSSGNGEWTSLASGTKRDLFAVFAIAGAGAWAVGEQGLILRSAGGVWAEETSGTSDGLTAIWGSSATDLYAGGGLGVGLLLHSTGNGKWVEQSGHSGDQVTGIWGSSASDVYAVGTPAISSGSFGINHGDGKTWEHTALMGGAVLTGVWGASPTEVYLAGWNLFTAVYLIYHGRYGAWQLEAVGPMNSHFRLNDVWGSSATDAYAVGQNLILHRRTPGPTR